MSREPRPSVHDRVAAAGAPTVAAVVVYAAFLTWFFLAGAEGPARVFVSDAVYIPFDLGVLALAFRAARRADLAPQTRRAWWWITAGVASRLVADTLWFWFEAVQGTDPYPSAADAFFLAFYPLALCGLLCFPSVGRGPRGWLTLPLDALTIAAGTWMVLWYLSVGPALQQTEEGVLTTTLNVAYPAGDLILILGVTIALLRGAPAGSRRALGLLALSMGLFTCADVGFSFAAVHPGVIGGRWFDLAWLGALALIGVAADQAVRCASRQPARGAVRPNRGWWWLLPAMAPVSVSVGLLVLWAAIAKQPFNPLGGLMLGATVLLTAVVLRQLVALGQERQAHRHVDERERGLEAEVDARTEDLSAAEAHFRSLVQHSNDVTTFVDRDLYVRWQSESIRRVLGTPPEALVGTCILDLLPSQYRADLSSVMRRASRQPGIPVLMEAEIAHADGGRRQIEAAVTRLPSEAPRQGWVLNTRDVTPHRRLQEELSHLAFHDPLTGLANRSLLSDRLEHALSRAGRTAAPLAVLAIDLDDFKAVNDSLGHATGDELLRQVATRLVGAVRQGDTVARLGGDEFAVLLDPADEQVSEEIAARILAALHAPCVVDEIDLSVEASIGIAGTEREAATADELLRNADLALYRAKASGKHRSSRYREELHDVATRRLALHSGLRSALEREELELHYQPIFDLASGDLIGAEALLRWTHDPLGSVSPVEFIPIAEETGLIIPIGAWVLEQACATAARWPERAPGASPVGIAVNLSVHQLGHPEIVEVVRATLERTGLAPRRLTLEVTESVLVADVEATAARLTELKALGVRIAIDDFGTGYSSLSALSHFPADVLKIDRSFVTDICSSVRHRDLATTIVRLGEALGMTTLAEGIETDEQTSALRGLGCEVGQGFRFSRPVPIAAFEALLGQAALVPAPA